MEEEHRSRLKQNKVALQGNLHIDEILLSHLIAEEVLTDAMKEQIDVRIPLFLTFRVHLDIFVGQSSPSCSCLFSVMSGRV